MTTLTLYARGNCPKCLQLKEVLDKKGILYSVVNLDDPTALAEFKKSYPDVRSVPFLAGHFVHFR